MTSFFLGRHRYYFLILPHQILLQISFFRRLIELAAGLIGRVLFIIFLVRGIENSGFSFTVCFKLLFRTWHGLVVSPLHLI